MSLKSFIALLVPRLCLARAGNPAGSDCAPPPAQQLGDSWASAGRQLGDFWVAAGPAKVPHDRPSLSTAWLPYPYPVHVPSRLRQCPVRTHIAPAHSLESRRTCTKAAGRRLSRPANDRRSSATSIGDEPLTTGVRGANDRDRLGVHAVKRTAGLTLWPGRAMPAPGAATWTQRCGTGRRAPGRPGGGLCDEDSLEQCWRQIQKRRDFQIRQ